jgi:hypothetical protein
MSPFKIIYIVKQIHLINSLLQLASTSIWTKLRLKESFFLKKKKPKNLNRKRKGISILILQKYYQF